MDTNRAYSMLEVKTLDDGERVITGIATTPEPDRVGDIVEPLGAQFKNPIPLLWQHRHDSPVGEATFGKPTKAGIPFTARIAKVDEPGALKDMLDLAWQSVKAKLVRAVSIGFRSLEHSYIEGTGGIRFLATEIMELSLVTIPANASATIQSIKSIDQQQRAASGNASARSVVRLSKAPVAGTSKTKAQEGSMNVQEQIKAFEAQRVEKATRMSAIMAKSAEAGETLDAEQEGEYDGLKTEVSTIDKHLERLREHEKAVMAKAVPVVNANNGAGGDGEEARKAAAAARTGNAPAVIKSIKNDEPGIGFARFALSMFAAKGDVNSAKAFAENKFGFDTRLQNVMKAAVAAGTTTSPTWAGNLVDYQNLSNEFIEFLRPRTIVGQFGVGGIPALRRVPFNSRIPGKTSAGRAGWVGEGYRKPATSAGYAAAELKWAKIAAISVVTEELERFSDPAIVQLTRDDLSDAVIERMDEDFVDPAKAVGTGATESPASITNGVTPIPSSGSDADGVRADIAALWAVADETNLPAGSAVYITDSKTARNLSLMRNPLGAREFPEVRVNGSGSIDGVPLIISNYVPSDTSGSLFILAFASEIYIADDGQVNIDISREATVFLDDAAATQTPTAAQLVSMFQTNQLAIRAERYVRWQKRRPQAVAYLNGVSWGG